VDDNSIDWSLIDEDKVKFILAESEKVFSDVSKNNDILDTRIVNTETVNSFV